jgi:hypothetical protein
MNAADGFWRYVGTTQGFGDDLRASCATTSTAHGDAVWRLTLNAPRRVTLTAQALAAWRPLLSVVSESCARRAEDPTSPIPERESSCVSAATGGAAEISAVLPAGTWFVVVDGDGSTGGFNFDVRIEAPAGGAGTDPVSTIGPACEAVPGSAARVALSDDGGSAPIAIGFAFPLYGQSFSRLAISANGFVQMLREADAPTALNTYANHVIPSTAAPNAVVAPFWDDLDPGMNGDRIRWWTGTAPRSLTVRWVDIPRWRNPGQRMTFEVRLEEGGVVQYRYCAATPDVMGSEARGTSASTGMESLDGRTGYLYSFRNGFYVPGRFLRFAPR